MEFRLNIVLLFRKDTAICEQNKIKSYFVSISIKMITFASIKIKRININIKNENSL